MMVIHKYPLILKDEQFLTLPWGSEILSVINQHEGLVLYALVDPGKIVIDKYLVVIRSTGQSVPKHCNKSNFLGTISTKNGHLIYHVFCMKVID